MTTPVSHTTEDQVKALVEKISAYVEQFHGGSVEFVSFDGIRLEVRLGGACLGCPLSRPLCRAGSPGQSTNSSCDSMEIQVVAAE
jgi:Fe-S cluster biogenesis protein NfuA